MNKLLMGLLLLAGLWLGPAAARAQRGRYHRPPERGYYGRPALRPRYYAPPVYRPRFYGPRYGAPRYYHAPPYRSFYGRRYYRPRYYR